MSIEVMNLSAGVQDVKWGWDQVGAPLSTYPIALIGPLF